MIRFMRDRRGISAMEFALIAPVLITLLLGAFDLGNAAFQYIQLDQVVRAGGQYALSNPSDVTGIGNVVSTAATDAGLTSVTVTGPTYFCSCDPAGTPLPGPVDCTAMHGAGLAGCSTPDQYVQLQVSSPLQYILFNLTNILHTDAGANYVARIQ
jgi:Flp pilus assembly protein TadG